MSTDSFLFLNAVLEARGLVLRKGFPESYDAEAMLATIVALHTGPAQLPVHNHLTYDIDFALTRTTAAAGIMIIEEPELPGFPDSRSASDALDVLIYLDVNITDIES